MPKVSIGYYAHHHGMGHVRRALEIARWMDRPLTVFSSEPLPEHDLGHVTSYLLDADVEANRAASIESTPVLGMHYSPLGLQGISHRMGAMVDWFRSHWPCLLVVDVSVEVALLARLCSVPTIYVRQNGYRTDLPHGLAYSSATALLAPFPSYVAGWSVDDGWSEKTWHTGFISRYADGVGDVSGSGTDSTSNIVAVLVGHGGTARNFRDLCDAAHATPRWSWLVLGPVATDPQADCPTNLTMAGVVRDPFAMLARARIVIGSAGDSVVSEMAALRCKFIVVPEVRPFDEQIATATALDRIGVAIHCAQWPSAKDWPELLARASALDPGRWEVLDSSDGAQMAADAIQTIADQVWNNDTSRP